MFLPILLLNPNLEDPLNGNAASMYKDDKPLYDDVVKGEETLVF